MNLMKSLLFYNQYLINPLLNSLSRVGRITLVVAVALVLSLAGAAYLTAPSAQATAGSLAQAEAPAGNEPIVDDESSVTKSQICKGAQLERPDSDADCETNDATGKISSIINRGIDIFSITVGITALIMLIYGGFRYVISQGAEKSVATAKKTVIYSIIGLVIAALAQVIIGATLEQL